MSNKNITTSVYTYFIFCIAFIDFMPKTKILLDYTNLLSPNKHEKNDKIIQKYFQYLETKSFL